MLNPKLQKKQEDTLTTTEGAKKIFQAIYQEQNPKKTNEQVARIKVSELISKMAFYYEKIRNTIDYKEEHLLRKNSIERILKRQIVIEGVVSLKALNANEVSKHLLYELIRAAYLTNNTVPETKIEEIGAVIEKYLILRKYALKQLSSFHIKEKNEVERWIIAMAASDIEERLGRSKTDKVIIDYMYDILLKNISLVDDSEYTDDLEIQIYIAIHRNYFKFDNDMISFILLKYYNSNWKTAEHDEIKAVAEGIASLRSAVETQVNHPLAHKLNKIARKYTVFFSILKDVVDDDPVKVYDNFKKDPKAFPRQIKNKCEKRYNDERVKLWRAGIRSILYLLITKSIFVILLEVPAVKFFGEEANIVSLAINVSLPAVLLFVVILFTRLPSAANTARIIEGVNEIVFIENEKKDSFKLGKAVKRSKTMQTFFGLFYLVTFFLTFGLVIWGLDKISFNWVSIIIFLFFLAFVSFFAIRIRKSTKELIVVEQRESIFGLIIDFFSIPVIETGKWLSEKFSRINVFVFIFDFIIEAPFKIFVEMAEEWTKYVKERKDEIV